ncbi:MAG: hypothetical protein J6J70_05270, partial [Methanocorpusculaceae archaeon]|nr:hypothetical protein [Methanocorpusculaceae archaeon]
SSKIGCDFFFQSAPGLHTCLIFTRHQFRPSRSVSSRPQILTFQVAHASPELRHRLSMGIGRGKPSASRSLVFSARSPKREQPVADAR